jgi:hypothetical protein
MRVHELIELLKTQGPEKEVVLSTRDDGIRPVGGMVLREDVDSETLEIVEENSWYFGDGPRKLFGRDFTSYRSAPTETPHRS